MLETNLATEGEMEKISVKICLGATCFVMGAEILQELCRLVPEKYGDRVELAGTPCMGYCAADWNVSKAPYAKVDNDVIKDATVEKIIAVIDEKLNK